MGSVGGPPIVGPADDPLEREAEAVASNLGSQFDPTTATQSFDSPALASDTPSIARLAIQRNAGSEDYNAGYRDRQAGGPATGIPRDGDALTDYNEGYAKGHYESSAQSAKADNYNAGYQDGSTGAPSNGVPCDGDALAGYNKGYAQGQQQDRSGGGPPAPSTSEGPPSPPRPYPLPIQGPMSAWKHRAIRPLSKRAVGMASRMRLPTPWEAAAFNSPRATPVVTNRAWPMPKQKNRRPRSRPTQDRPSARPQAPRRAGRAMPTTRPRNFGGINMTSG